MSIEISVPPGLEVIDIPSEWNDTTIQEPAETTPPAVKEPAPNPYQNIQAISASELIALELPTPEFLLAPWLRVGQSALLAAKAGIGKTFVALTVAKCVATAGSMLDDRWYSPNALKVLYIDGEMASVDMQARLKSLKLDSPNFLLVNQDFFPDSPAIELANLDCQRRIQELIEVNNVSLVIVDNIATLYHCGRSDSMEFWQVMQTFVLDLRRKGIACLIVDHEGKSGENGARGTSAKNDIMYAALSLKRPEDYDSSQGARFEVRFTKNRGFSGPDAAPFEAWLHEECGQYKWTVSDIVSRAPAIKQTKQEAMRHENELIATLLADGRTVEEITAQTGLSKSTVYNRKKGFNPDGQLQPGEYSEFSQFGKDRPK